MAGLLRFGVALHLSLGDAPASRDEDEFRRIEARHSLLEGEREAWPERAVAPVLVEVPALAAARRPHRASHLRVDLGDERLLRALARLDARERERAHVADGVDDVLDLALDHRDHGRVPEAGVRPLEEE